MLFHVVPYQDSLRVPHLEELYFHGENHGENAIRKHPISISCVDQTFARATEGPRRLAVCLRLIQPDGEVRWDDRC